MAAVIILSPHGRKCTRTEKIAVSRLNLPVNNSPVVRLKFVFLTSNAVSKACENAQLAAVQRALGVLRLNEAMKDKPILLSVELPHLVMHTLAQQLAHDNTLAQNLKRQLPQTLKPSHRERKLALTPPRSDSISADGSRCASRTGAEASRQNHSSRGLETLSSWGSVGFVLGGSMPARKKPLKVSLRLAALDL